MSSSPEETNTGPVIRDLRRIDPATGQVRDPGQAAAADASQRGPGKPGPGRHAASQPGGTRTSAAPDPGAARETGPAASEEPAPSPGAAVGPSAAPAEGRAEPSPGGPVTTGQAIADQLAERTADLQRVTAEYANYRKRVERDRMAVREQALANVLQSLLPVFDDIGRAREHGELVGGFKSVAESLEGAATKLGLNTFGEEGEPFDPNVHEALMHSYSADVTEPSCVRILQPGYRVGDRILRPARVAVAEPGEPGEPGEPAAAAGPQEPAEPGPAAAAGPQEPAEPGPAAAAGPQEPAEPGAGGAGTDGGNGTGETGPPVRSGQQRQTHANDD